MFRRLELNTSYSSEEDDLYRDFYLPTLGASVLYKRAVGFFSLAALLTTPSAISQLVESGGQIQLIIGKLVSQQDFEALKAGYDAPWADDIMPKFQEVLSEHEGSLLEYRIRLLAWLFQNDQLAVKFAIRPNGLFHQKIGILTDKYGDKIAFSGSMNETMSALDPRYNSEEITVYQSWVSGQNEYLESHETKFDQLWSGAAGSTTIICTMPEAMSAGLNLVIKRYPERPTSDEEAKRVEAFFKCQSDHINTKPIIPKGFKGNPFELREHQVQALRSWKDRRYNGILELATGAGKTVTAIYGAVKTIEANTGFVLIVAVPYRDLADQWCEELRMFNINALKCYGSRSEWYPALSAFVRRNRGNQSEFMAIVVVNNTLKSDHFQNHISELDQSRIFFIGDECHHHGAAGFVGKLFPDAGFRIGLSATPFHYLDEDRNTRIHEIYMDSVYKYTLADAVRDKVLTPYEYMPIPVELTEDEATEYLELSDQIARVFMAAQGAEIGTAKDRLTALLMKRARLVGAAQNKLPALKSLLEETGPVEPFSLFYCGDGRTIVDRDDRDRFIDEGAAEDVQKQRIAVASMLMQRNVRVSPFTSDESKTQRRQILENFKKGETEALVAIRCLDEGIDVPDCRSAYLIASSRNPRQFVQRRGRILRKAPGKEYAKVYDFVVVLPTSAAVTTQQAGDFLKNELERVADFASNSLYPSTSLSPLLPWLEAYGLEHLGL